MTKRTIDRSSFGYRMGSFFANRAYDVVDGVDTVVDTLAQATVGATETWAQRSAGSADSVGSADPAAQPTVGIARVA
jgi:hypothetical protein